MNPSSTDISLSVQVEQLLNDLVNAAKAALADNLRSVVLFGSAAEGQMRATSDVNLILVLTRFDRVQVDRIREPLRMAHAAARVSAMFVLESELPVAAEAFAVKFADIGRRRRVLFGEDVFARLKPSRDAQLSEARETRALPAGVAVTTLFGLLDLAETMRGRVERLGGYAA